MTNGKAADEEKGELLKNGEQQQRAGKDKDGEKSAPSRTSINYGGV